MNMIFVFRVCLIFFSLVLLACAGRWEQLQLPLEKVSEEIACVKGSSAAFDVLHRALETSSSLPEARELQSMIEAQLQKSWSHQLSRSEIEQLAQKLLQFYSQVELATSAETEIARLQQSLAAFEVGIYDGFILSSHTLSIQNSLSEVKDFSKSLGIQCEDEESIPQPGPDPLPVPRPIQKMNIGSSGRYTMAVAYQSCSALDVKPLSSRSASVEGIAITGTHTSGTGKKREIGDLEKVQSTHPYVRGVNYPSSCFAVAENPLIYDYGGKPYATSVDNLSLNLFKDAGSGTKVLGIDCSGFVFSAVGAAGLKLDPKKVMKASLVSGIPARAYMDPAKNGMPCFEKIKVGESGTLKEGDLIASSGHIVIVDRVGDDPFGILNKTASSQCSGIKSSDFDFTISQSSPSKGGVGINRYLASDYLPENGSFKSALETYARKACEARLQNKEILIEGLSAQVVRHSMSSECAAPPLRFERSECVNNCSNIN
jgi:hypothetical protein